MNINSNNLYQFYTVFHFSSNSRKGIDKSEKENFVCFIEVILKQKIINARTLLKSFQPIHRLINRSNKIYKFKRLKKYKMKY